HGLGVARAARQVVVEQFDEIAHAQQRHRFGARLLDYIITVNVDPIPIRKDLPRRKGRRRREMAALPEWSARTRLIQKPPKWGVAKMLPVPSPNL
ncbi:MAG: hypothetical protein ABIZ56_07800, partial [Chthoniobacteraceae bacterium]